MAIDWHKSFSQTSSTRKPLSDQKYDCFLALSPPVTYNSRTMSRVKNYIPTEHLSLTLATGKQEMLKVMFWCKTHPDASVFLLLLLLIPVQGREQFRMEAAECRACTHPAVSSCSSQPCCRCRSGSEHPLAEERSVFLACVCGCMYVYFLPSQLE